MRITEDQIIYIFLLGTAVGSAITYFAVTRDKRIISNVRKDIRNLSDIHELTSDELRKAESEEIASDQKILALHRWAIGMCHNLKKEHRIKIDAAYLTAEVIICGEFFGLDSLDATQIYVRFWDKRGTFDELRAAIGEIIGKKSKGILAEEQRRIRQENYEREERERRSLKDRILTDLEAISKGERRSFSSEGINAAKALQERHAAEAQSRTVQKEIADLQKRIEELKKPDAKSEPPEHSDIEAAWASIMNAMANETVDAEAIHDQIDDVLYPDTLEEIGTIQEIWEQEFEKLKSKKILCVTQKGMQASRALAKFTRRQKRNNDFQQQHWNYELVSAPVLKSGVADDMAYILYLDGSIAAHLPRIYSVEPHWSRFDSFQEFRQFLMDVYGTSLKPPN